MSFVGFGVGSAFCITVVVKWLICGSMGTWILFVRIIWGLVWLCICAFCRGEMVN